MLGIKKFVLYVGILLSLNRNRTVHCTILRGNYSAIQASWTMWSAYRELLAVQSLEIVSIHSENYIMVFCDVVPCSLVYRYKCYGFISHFGIFYCGSGSIRFFQNVGTSVPYYIVLYPIGHNLDCQICESLSFHIERFFVMRFKICAVLLSFQCMVTATMNTHASTRCNVCYRVFYTLFGK